MKAFDCKMCGECCYGEGGIFMEENEQKRIAEHLGLEFGDFLAQYTVELNGRTYAAVGPDNFCIFFRKEKGCTIHTVKPDRCELWPYFPANVADPETWDLAKVACRGINRECSFEDFVKSSPKGGNDEK
jgi:Fe-S-cluster containining protein